MPSCDFCQPKFATHGDLSRHQSLAPTCKAQKKEKYAVALARLAAERKANKLPRTRQPSTTMENERGAEDDLPAFMPDDNVPESDSYPDPAEPPADKATNMNTLGRQKWKECFAKTGLAGETNGRGKTPFELIGAKLGVIKDDEILKGAEVLGPFKDEEEWELAKWLIKYVGHTAADEFLKLRIIADRAKPSYTGKKSFLETVDELPGGVEWQCQELDVEGDLPDLEKDPTGVTMRTETLELWWPDPVECVRELIGNPMFSGSMKFAPERLYTDASGSERVISEMWTADWWWELQHQINVNTHVLQKRLPPGATIAPLILSSDKTLLSNFRGDNSAWPVYLSIGNINKDTRRQVSAHATVLIGYLPVPKFDCFDKNTRSLQKYRLFHQCMATIMASVAEAGKRGVSMVCADNFIRNVWPIFAAYVADYPEQCLIACCKENRCPICKVPATKRGEHVPYPKRDQQETLAAMARQQAGEKEAVFEEDGIRPGFTPDLLHQLHKGVFKDHLVKWCTEIIGKTDVDNRFRKMPDHPGLRHFKNGISSVSQWTGTEHKEMEKVFLGLVASGTNDEVVQAVAALMDFASLASLQSHTSTSLLLLRAALDNFHAHKHIFIELEARKNDFNFPKLHSLDHYEPLIRLFGSADGFNTESPERLHIDYAKNAYRASNRKDYIQQMTLWLQRQEAVARFTAFREWIKSRAASLAGPTPVVSSSQQPQAAPFHSSSVPSQSLPQADLTAVQPDSETLTITAYSIAKAPPSATRHVAGSHIVAPEGHNAVRFFPALQTFLQKAGSTFIPQPFDLFGTWKRMSFKLPKIPEVGGRHSLNLVRATAPVTLLNEIREAAHHDFALVRTGEVNKAFAMQPLEPSNG
ncbi:hypothetical protein K438DRAFT_1768866 [Mycena galopus ATCC 62051]|nr:hypothetical protein K438DRAFT_1768866 [Mycena galopus ATCC 62051]